MAWLVVLEQFADYHRVGSTFPSRYQIWCNDRCPNYGPKMKFNMAAAAILNLLPVAIFDIQPTFHFWAQPPHKIISCQYLNRRLTYDNFSNFKMAAVRHLRFRKSDFWPRWPWAADFPSWYQIWCKMLIDAQVMAKKRNSKWRLPISCIYFRPLFLTYSRLSTFEFNHHTKFGANISVGGWLMVTFQNSRWRPSGRHLGFSKIWFLTNR